jgi:hypothetical protein
MISDVKKFRSESSCRSLEETELASTGSDKQTLRARESNGLLMHTGEQKLMHTGEHTGFRITQTIFLQILFHDNLEALTNFSG